MGGQGDPGVQRVVVVTVLETPLDVGIRLADGPTSDVTPR